MVFCHIFSFGVISAPMSYSLNLFPFPWIELLNEILTSIFSDFISASFIGSRSSGCHATRFFLACKATGYIVEEARKKKLPFTLGKVLYSVYRKSPHHGRYPRCGSSSVENIDDFFFHDCKLN